MRRSFSWLCFMNVILVGMAFVVLDNDVFNVDYHSGFAEIFKKKIILRLVYRRLSTYLGR